MAKARTDVEEISEEVQRVRVWLESDRRTHWEREFRKRSLTLQELQQQLFGAKLSQLRNETAAQALAVERAKRALREAEEKRAAVKRWTREFENRAQPLAKQIDQLLTFLSTDLAKAVSHLHSVIAILESYSGGGATPHATVPANADAAAQPGEISDTQSAS